jgi:ABC-type phosphate transport system substrate-binding protein
MPHLELARRQERERVRLWGRKAGAFLFLWAAVMAALLAAALSFEPGPARAAEPFVVIVNAANPVSSVPADQLASLFLKKVTQWKGGLPAAPVDLPPDSAVRESFSHQIHHKGTAAVKAYWQQMIFSGREVPPPEKASAREVVAFVSANRGGVGYVPVGTPLGAEVKAVDVKP